MTFGSYTVGGTSYNYRTAQLTSGSSITAGSKTYSLTATDNGGSTPTQGLLTGSPAINAANPCTIAIDQRGLPRPNPCDAGAYEFGDSPTLTSLAPSSAMQGGGSFTLIVTGTGFISGTVALWNGSVRSTTVLNTTTLSVAIPAGDLAAAGQLPPAAA